MMWAMLKAWTSLEVEAFAGRKINTSANAIVLTQDLHSLWGGFDFYLQAVSL